MVDKAQATEWETVLEEYGETIKWTQKGQEFVSTYVGNKTVDLVDDDGEIRPTVLFEFKSGDEKFGVWETHNLAEAMKKIEVGKLVRILYMGKVEGLKGGRSVQEFRVFQAK